MSQFPVPRPQATVVDTYAPAALVQPTAPVQYAPGYAQGLMPGTEMSQALRRLSGALSQYGPSLVASEAEKAKELEDIRLARMTTDEIRADLMSQAKAMEQNGTLSAGSNPYRLMAIQENLATRVMRDEFESTLAANLNKFSSPDNTEDAAEFALETFQNIQLPGYFGKAKAAQMYQAATDKWLNQVQQQRNVRMAARNREDLSDTAYASLNRMYSDPTIGLDTTAAELSQAMDEFYALTGESGRDQVVTAISTLVATKGRAAAKAGDEEELDRLQTMLDRIRESGGKALQFGSSYDSEFDALETSLDEFRESARNKDRVDDEDLARDVSSEVFMEFAREGKLSSSTDSEFSMQMSQRLEEAGVSQGTISRILEGLPTRVNQYLRQTEFDPDVYKELAKSALSEPADQFRADVLAALANGTISPSQVEELTNMAFRANFQRDTNIAGAQQAGPVAVSSAEQFAKNLLGDLVDTNGFDFGAGAAAAETTQLVLEAGSEVYRSLPPDDPTRDEKTRKAMEEAAKNLRKLTINREGVTYYDIDKAVELGYSDAAVDAMVKSNRANADRAASVPTSPEDISIPTAEAVELQDAYFDFRYDEYIALVDNIAETNLGSDLTTATDYGNQIYTSANRSKSKYTMKVAGKPTARITPSVTVVAEVATDGLYYTKWTGERVKADDSHQEQYAQAVRLSGLEKSELIEGKTKEGLLLDARPEFWDPGLTVMAYPGTFVADVQRVIETNGFDVTEEQLLERLKDTNLAMSYQAYAQGRGEQAVSFGTFLNGQIRIMNYVGAPTPSEVLIELRRSGSRTGNSGSQRPVGQENN